MNIINKQTLLVTTLLVATHALVAMERVQAKTQEKAQTAQRLTDEALIAKLSKAAMQGNFERYFELLSPEPLERQRKLCDANLLISEWCKQKKALHFAAQQGNTVAVRKLMWLGSNVHEYGEDGMVPILYAAQSGSRDIFLLFLEAGANKLAFDESGRSALHWAAAGNHINLLTALIKDHGLNPHLDLQSDAGTPLHVAVANGHIPAINTLIDLGARKDKLTARGATALHMAAKEGKKSAVVALIKNHGFDPNAADGLGQTPLFYAASENGNLETFDALLEQGARVAEGDHVGASVLHLAAKGNKSAIIVSLIREHNFNPNIETNRGSTPLACAIANKACMAEFALHCAGGQLTDREKQSYYPRSCLRDLTTTADKQTMLDALSRESLAPWDPNCANHAFHATPLITAIQRGCIRCVKLFLKDPRTNPNQKDRYLKVPLHYIVEQWHDSNSAELCSRLLNLKRINVGIQDGAGKTARQYLNEALQKGYTEKLGKLLRLFELRKMRVQAYLSLKNARCSKQCSEKVCTHLPQLPADVCFKIVGMLTEESLPEIRK